MTTTPTDPNSEQPMDLASRIAAEICTDAITTSQLTGYTVRKEGIAALIRPFVGDLEAKHDTQLKAWKNLNEAENRRFERELASARQAKQAALGMVAQMREALEITCDALEHSYDATEHPADGSSGQEKAAKIGRQALASAVELLGEAGS